MKKKILSLLLAAVMVLSMMVVVPITASAEGNTFSDSNYANTETFTISTAEDLVAFAASVYNEKSYSGKTVNVAADITLSPEQSAAWTGIGYGDNGSDAQNKQHFRGTFNGNGYTIDLGNVSTSQNHAGGLFRGIGDGAIVKNFKLQGTIAINGEIAAVGAVACRAWGTITLQNIQCSVNFTMSGGPILQVGGLVGYIHHNQAIDLTIDGCIYDGLIDCSASANRIGGFIGSTGINSSYNRDIKIENSVYAGNIRLGDSAENASYYIGGILGHVRSDNANTPVNITLEDVVSIGAITFASGKEWGSQQRGVLYGGLGDEDNTQTGPLSISHTNVFYVAVENYDGTEMPLYGGSQLGANGGSMTSIRNNSYKKTLDQIAALTSSNFSDGAAFSFNENTLLDTYYPCPSYFAQNGAWADSLKVSVDAMVQGAQIRYNNDATLYSGIRFVAKFRASEVDLEKIGSADANFGLILVSEAAYEALGAEATFDAIVAAGVKVPALLAENENGIVTVKAVVYNIDKEDYDKNIVAIPYIDNAVAGDALARSIYYVANECVNDESDEVDPAAKEYSQGIVDYVNAQNSDD